MAASLVAGVLQLLLGIALITLWRVTPEYRAFFWTADYLFFSAPVNIARFAISGKGQRIYFYGLFGPIVLTFGETICAAYGVRLKRWRYLGWIAIIAVGLTANPVLQPLIAPGVAAAMATSPCRRSCGRRRPSSG